MIGIEKEFRKGGMASIIEACEEFSISLFIMQEASLYFIGC